MFTQFFGFRENPFKTGFDPEYLFLGKQHEEAIAHLNYALMEGEGFIAITGNQGVGKTMVCRSFVEKLDPSTAEYAYMDNPAPNAQQLLKTIDARFQICSSDNSIKKLIDALNAFLMQKKLEGKKVFLFFDNAHRLTSDVLEQIRLISNLETSRDKLVQIVLIGEPELSDMLASRQLRQIGQRVSVGYHIHALSFEETMGYIQHRLNVASSSPLVRFDQKAVRRIFKFSGGIPRTINVVCDRALTVACARNEQCVTDEIAKKAITHLSQPASPAFWDFWKHRYVGWVIPGCCVLLAMAAAIYFFRLYRPDTPSEVVKAYDVSVAPSASENSSGSSVSPVPSSKEASIGDNKAALQAERPSPTEPRATELSDSPASASISKAAVSTVSEKAAEPAEQVASSTPDALGLSELSVSAASSDTDVAVANKNAPAKILPADASKAATEGSSAVTAAAPKMMTHSVQVGAFRSIELAQQLVARLNAKGYSARMVPFPDHRGGRWYTVRIGDHPSREAAQRQADSFTAQEKMESVVRPYNAL
jgi:type II secretory pathway predicted ATPase ExeA/cell division septation protein DedD